MLSRQNKISVRLNDEEYAVLKERCSQSGLKMEPLIRKLLADCKVKAAPDAAYIKLSRELSILGNNLNQIAHVTNATGHVSQAQLDEVHDLMLTAWQLVRDSL